VLERRPLIGGAAVTEEVFPGFKFSVFSYVVSLLRPEIIATRSAEPRPSDPAAREHRHAARQRRLPGSVGRSRRDAPRARRHSPRDADAADRFGRLMHHMAMAVKPILAWCRPIPHRCSPSDLRGLLKLGGHFRSLGAERFHALHKLMTMSSADYLDEWFEFDALKATKSASGIIGTFLGPRSPGSAYVLLHHYMGEIDGAFRAWGFQKGGTGAISEPIASARARTAPRSAPTAAVRA
jgi:phytoene dehydrogenase-like protein